MHKKIGVFAHVDAGKTTFSEQLLYRTGSIRTAGRVDHQNSWMDTDIIERRRGITIFADQAMFTFNGSEYCLIDTPGHVDFSAEAERSMAVLDYAILLISSEGVQAHTTTLYSALKSYGIPMFIFVNKLDLPEANIDAVMQDIAAWLTPDIVHIPSPGAIDAPDEPLLEAVAERSEDFLDKYLSGNTDGFADELSSLTAKGELIPVMGGAALKGEGVDEFLSVFDRLIRTEQPDTSGTFSGQVYKIRHDESGARITFIKALSGELKVKDEFTFRLPDGSTVSEKVNEIRIYSGARYEQVNRAAAGEVCAVVGLKSAVCGSIIKAGEACSPLSEQTAQLLPALKAGVKLPEGEDIAPTLSALRMLEAEDPMLGVTFVEETRELTVNIMGRIQLEVLEQTFERRFGRSISFGAPKVQYRESIEGSVVGYGHYEPLRHYAEVQLRLTAAPRGSGITYQSKCHVDRLLPNFQNLVRTHVFERMHKGVLTGSPITDIHIELLDGRSHIKHTSGGDFREATYRAIRQGLEKANSVLLEPYYDFTIYAASEHLGRIMADIPRLRGTMLQHEIHSDTCVVQGRGPVATFMPYVQELAAFSHGMGSIALRFGGYDICGDAQQVIADIAYDKGADREHTSCSVFCSHGTSFVVNWDEAEQYMHTLPAQQ